LKHSPRTNNNHTINKNKIDAALITHNDTGEKREINLLSENNIAKRNEGSSDNSTYSMYKNNKPSLYKSSKEKNIQGSNEGKDNEPEIEFSARHPSKNILDPLVNNSSTQITAKPDENISATEKDQRKALLQKDSLSKNARNVKTTTITIREPIIKDLSLEVYFSPDIPVSQTSSANTAYLQHKDSTSKMQLSYTAGVKLSALFGEHVLAKVGFQYSEINEKFNYTNKNAVRTVPVVIQRLLADETGAMHVVFDTSNLIQAGTQYKLTYNHYKSIDIPILIGYETSGDRFKAAINTGIILNIKTSYSGDVLDASLNPIDIGSNSVYKSNTGASLYLGLSLAARLNNSFHLFTEPYIRYRLSNMTGTYEPFAQKINVGGLSFGLRYNLKNNRQHN
ncbi:MAG TPA: hypothetical protein VH396_09830, partial [Chitinophagaceae bacterium]